MIRVLLVDDHPVVLAGLAASLAEIPEVEVAGTAASRAEAVDLLERSRFDVVLVDVRLPDGSGLDLLSIPGAAGPAFIVVSSFDSPEYVAEAVYAGAAGYLLKTAPLERLAEAIRTVAAGGTVFEARHLRTAHDRPRVITRRERGILEGVAAGHSNERIAADLGVSRKTVEVYLTRLYRRFDEESRAGLAVRAQREGWLE
jgi:DNA-binding NarL/FixJ family response regulator